MGTEPSRINPLELDLLANAAWPALVCEPLRAWVLRATQGVTNRANSVLTVGKPGAAAGRDVTPDIDAAESFYRRQALPPCFYISPATQPPELDAALARRGYVLEKPTEVWTADASHAPPLGDLNDVKLAAAADPDWCDCAFDEPQPRRAVHEAIVNRIDRPRTFASIRLGGRVISCGLAVSERQWTGIFCMATTPEHRRRGLASRVLAALIASTPVHGDRRLYLQVMTSNAAARSLYHRFGFRFAYAYHYRTLA